MGNPKAISIVLSTKLTPMIPPNAGLNLPKEVRMCNGRLEVIASPGTKPKISAMFARKQATGPEIVQKRRKVAFILWEKMNIGVGRSKVKLLGKTKSWERTRSFLPRYSRTYSRLKLRSTVQLICIISRTK